MWIAIGTVTNLEYINIPQWDQMPRESECLRFAHNIRRKWQSASIKILVYLSICPNVVQVFQMISDTIKTFDVTALFISTFNIK